MRQRWIPLLALLPLLTLMAADMVMVTLAARSDPGLVTDAPRRLGLARLAPEAALKLDVSLRPGPDGYALALRLRDAAGAMVPATAAEGQLQRTTHAGADRPLRLASRPDGTWWGTVTLPDTGAWQVTVTARDAGGRSALAVVRLAP